MQTLFILVALICLRLQIALPLATSYDYDLLRYREFADSENLVQRHHVRHRTSHLHSSDNIRHEQQHTEMEKSESATEFSKQAANGDDAKDATDSSNVERYLHYHPHEYKVHPDRNNYRRAHHNSHYEHQQHYKHHNLIQTPHAHAHLHHRNVPKARTNTMATATAIDSETSSSPSTIGLVQPTSHPTANVAHTIILDEVNNSTQNNNYNQALLRQHHKPHRHQLQQQHHHKLQLKSDLSETKHTKAPVNGFQHNLPAITQQHTDHNKMVHAALRLFDSPQSDNHMPESINNNVTTSVLEQSTSVGGSTENILVTTSESTIGGHDETTEYVDDEVDYYDYTMDNDESNMETRDYQHALTAVDVGYYYDSGIDDDEADWLAHTTKNSRNEYHQHTRHSQEPTQPHRRQQTHKKQKQHDLETQSYRNEHFRVARDHQRAQSEQFGHTNLVYDSRAEDEYPDDEPYKDSSEQYPNRPGELTFQKYRELGTMQAVQQSRDLYMQRHKSPSDLATEHINRMRVAARCSRPLARVFHVSNDTSKTYVPSCTILHRCGEDAGCCRSMGQVCTVKTYEDVPLHFIVIQVNSSNSRRQTEVEILRLRNDTECHCINRTDLTSSPEFNTRDKRSGLAVRRPIQSHFDALDSQKQLTNRSTTEENNENDPNSFCRCPKHFDVFQEDIRWPSAQQRRELYSSSAPAFNCRCDCADIATPCHRFKNGEEGFAMDDRRCIADKICSVPSCSFGIFNEQIGRCPRPSRKHKRHNNGFG